MNNNIERAAVRALASVALFIMQCYFWSYIFNFVLVPDYWMYTPTFVIAFCLEIINILFMIMFIGAFVDNLEL